MEAGGCGEVLTSAVVSASFAVAMTVPSAFADEAVDDVLGAGLAVGDPVLSVDAGGLDEEAAVAGALRGLPQLLD